MADVNQLVTLMKGGTSQYNELRRVVVALPLGEAFADCRAALAQLSPDERFDLWHSARTGPKDRLAGILCVAEGRMPSLPVFGAFNMPAGDKLTNYDLARRFLLENNRQPGAWMPDFYPEFRQLVEPRKRVLAIAAAHVNCDAVGMKQVNLFALCGKLDLKEAEKSSVAEGPGTTCAFFMRAVLRAAGDARMIDTMLTSPPDMLMAMGVHGIDAPPFVNTLQPPGKSKTPRAGDLYHIRIPGVVLRRPGEPKKFDAGHVGFVTSDARVTDGKLEFNSIDGGSTGTGNTTVTNTRLYARNGGGYWEARNMAKVADEHRILVGFVDLDQVTSSFDMQSSTSLDGRSIDAQYPG